MLKKHNKKDMKYKKSRFNYIHKYSDGRLRMYNSMVGTKSLLQVNPTCSIQVQEALKSEIIDSTLLSEDKLQVLYQKGYIVSQKYDEEKALELRKMNILSNDKVLSIIIMPTEECNFRCKYCYETFKKGKMSNKIQEAILKYVQKNIKNYTELSVIWFGGEPLEAIDVIEKLSKAFIRICKTARKTYSASITTNGFNLTPENYQKLYECNIYGYQITIDGCKEQHDSQRILQDGSGTFQKIINNLIYIRDHPKRGTAFAIRTNFTKQIMSYLDEYIDFFQSNFGKCKQFSLFIQTVSDWGGERVNDFTEEIISPKHKEILSKLKEYNVNLNMPGHCYGLDCSTAVCYAAKVSSIVIGSDGHLYKCTRDFEMPENQVGELSNNGELILNENWQLWLNRVAEKKPKCNNCFFEANCLRAVCPFGMVSGEKEIFCSPEKVNLGSFLEVFNDNLFTVME